MSQIAQKNNKTTLSAENMISAAGLKQSVFNVDPSGQANYRIHIDVPPGIAGLQPELDLVYNHRQSNGILGIGWGLSGLSAISRAKATYAVDGFNAPVNYTNLDRYTLDGQRLINVQGGYGQPGSVYRTEIESWKNIVAGASPAEGFTVVTKNGQVWKYGTTTDSCILASGGNGVRVWALHSVEDTNGNRIEFTYTLIPVTGATATGAYYISGIQYTVRDDTTANRFVQFTYEERPDPIEVYIGGYPVLTSYRLSRIDVSVANNNISGSYLLTYNTSVATRMSCLQSVTQYGAVAEGSQALPPTKVLWQDTAAPGFDIGPVSLLDQHISSSNIQPMDISGSGRTDIVQLWVDGDNEIHATSYLATTGQNGVSFVRAADCVLGAFPETRQFFAADVNGDGRTDLLLAYQDSLDNSLKLAVFLSDGSSFTDAGVFDTGDTWTSSHIAFFAMDVNGDGRTDLVEAYAHFDPDQGQLLYFRSYLSIFGDGSGSMFTEGIVSPTEDAASLPNELNMWPMDVNGDGMMDLVRIWQRGSDDHIIASAYISAGTSINNVGFTQKIDSDLGNFNLSGQIAFLPADINGDGVQDLLQVWQEQGSSGTTLHLTSFLCDGNGGFLQGPDSFFDNQTIDPNAFYPMGFSGGGQTNLLCKWISGDDKLMFTVYASSQKGTFRHVTDFMAGTAGSAVTNATFFAGDANGDGKADLLRVSLNQDNQLAILPYTSSGPYPDLVESITSPLGGVVSIQYAPLTDTAVYSSGAENAFPKSQARRYPNPLSPIQFPIQAILGRALYVVSAYSESNDPDLNRFSYLSNYQMTYAGGQLDLMGRGWEGFSNVTKLNLVNGQKNISVYNLDFPLTGTLQSSIAAADGTYSTDPKVPKSNTNVVLQVVSSEYQAVTRAQSATDPSQLVVEILETTNQSNVYNYGQENFDYAIRKTYAYDDFGNRTLEIYLGYVDPSTLQPLFPDEVVYQYKQYQNQVSANGWALGYLLYSKVSANASDPDITKFFTGDLSLEQRSYTTPGYNLAVRGVWDSVYSQYQNTSYTYDQYGNKITETLPGGAVTSFTYDPDYHTYLMTRTSPANNQGEQLVSSYGFDPRFGAKVATVTENGCVFISGLDGFGRTAAQQGPVPVTGGVQSDPNVLTSFVTGISDLKKAFSSALVITLETDSYLSDDTGGQYIMKESLQSFPTTTARDFLWNQGFTDIKGLERQNVQQSGQASGNIVSQTDYSLAGKPVKQSLPVFGSAASAPAVSYIYDVLDRPINKLSPTGADSSDSSLTTWDYAAGGITTETSAAGTDSAFIQVVEHHWYNGTDQIKRVEVTTDGNATTNFVYDRIGRLLKTTDPVTASNPAGVSNLITYNSLDQKLSLDNPDQNTTNNANIKAFIYTYDQQTGQLSTQTDAAGVVTTYTYDLLGRVLAKTYSDGRAVKYIYDTGLNGKGILGSKSILLPDGSVESAQSFGYDSYGNTTSTSLEIKSESAPFVTTSVFDPQKRLVSQTQPDSTTLIRTYQDGVLVNQTMDGANVDYPLESYTALGKFGRTHFDNGVTTEYTFSATGLLYGENVSNSNSDVLNLSYSYDPLNQMLGITDTINPGQTQAFTYLNRRLATAVTPSFNDGSYTYDQSGNIVKKDGGDYTYQAHFVKTITNAGNQTYAATPDACGRLQTRITNGQSQVFGYSTMGNLEQVSLADGTILQKIISDDLGNRLLEEKADGTVIVYINPFYKITRNSPKAGIIKYLSDVAGCAASIATDASGTRNIQYFRRDHKGSITLCFDSTGQVVNQVVYDGYGSPLTILGNDDGDVKYENKPWDADLGLYYYGARYYDPFTGRFISPDSQIGAVSFLQPDAFNRFAFELNNPVNYIDPNGHTASWVAGLIIGLIAVAAGIAIVASLGTATPIVAALGATGAGLLASALGTAFIAAGASAAGYSISHRDNFSWKDYGIQTSISFGVGLISGGLFFGVAAATSGVSVLSSIGLNALGGAVISGAADVGSQALTNLAEGNNVSDGLVTAAIFGVVFGGLGGALAGRAAAAAKIPGGVEEAVGEATPLVRFKPAAYGTFDEPVAQNLPRPYESFYSANVRKALYWQIFAASVTPIPEAVTENELG
jgi:RHS repeat-associated protein